MLERLREIPYLKKVRQNLVPFLQSKRGYGIFSLFLAAACGIGGYFFFPLPGVSRLLSAVAFILSALFLSFTGYLLQQFRTPQHRSRLHIATIFTGAIFAGLYIFFQPSIGLNGLRTLLAIGIGTLASHLLAYPLVRQTGAAMKRYPWAPKLLATLTALGSFAGLAYAIATDNVEDLLSFFLGYPWVLVLTVLFVLPLGYALFSRRDMYEKGAVLEQGLPKGEASEKDLEEVKKCDEQKTLEEINREVDAILAARGPDWQKKLAKTCKEREEMMAARESHLQKELERIYSERDVILAEMESPSLQEVEEMCREKSVIMEAHEIDRKLWGLSAAPPPAARRGSIVAGNDPHFLATPSPSRKNVASAQAHGSSAGKIESPVLEPSNFR